MMSKKFLLILFSICISLSEIQSQTKPCEEGCATCEPTDITKCKTCKTNYYFQGKWNVTTKKYDQVGQKCYTANNGLSQSQLSLGEKPMIFFHLIEKFWIQCGSNCLNCKKEPSVITQDSCKTCQPKLGDSLPLYRLASDKTKEYGKCFDSVTANKDWFVKENMWFECDDNDKCATCETSSDNCKTCKYDLEITDKCSTCKKEFFKVKDSSDKTCYKTKDKYFLKEKLWNKCDDSCSACVETAENCKACLPNYYKVKESSDSSSSSPSSPVDSKCYKVKDGYFVKENFWTKCDKSCATCDPSSGVCKTCSIGYNKVKDTNICEGDSNMTVLIILIIVGIILVGLIAFVLIRRSQKKGDNPSELL